MARNAYERRHLVIGGAGFVGTNLVRSLVSDESAEVVVVDNLLSSNRTEILGAANVRFIEGSIASDEVLRSLTDEYDTVFHLATYHGNQSSIADPLADHQNNLLTTLKLFERIKDFRRLERVIYTSAGCTVAEKTYGDAHATREDDPISLKLDSPYQSQRSLGRCMPTTTTGVPGSRSS